MQQQQQAAIPFGSPIPANPNAAITTDQIQKCLDENKQLILAILDNQNLGKLAECAQYQALLQKNLLFLAAIADAQPQAPAARPQMTPQGAMQQGGQFMPQGPSFPPRSPFNPQQVQQQQQLLQQHHAPNPQQVQQQQQQQLLQQHHAPPFQGHMGMRPVVMNGMRPMHAETTFGGSRDLPSSPGMADFARGGTANSAVDVRGSKQSVESVAGEDGRRGTAMEQGSGCEPALAKGPEDGNTP